MSEQADNEPVLYRGRYVVAEGYARSAARAFMRFQLTRPSVWIRIGLILVIVPLLELELLRDRFSGSIAIGLDLVLVIGFATSWAVNYRRIATRLALNEHVGSTRELALTESTITVTAEQSMGRSPYRAYESANVSAGFVLLRVRGTKSRVIVARELFSDEALAFFRAKVAG